MNKSSLLPIPVLLALGVHLAPAQPITDAERLFTLKIKPLLSEKCTGCHGGSGGLTFSTTSAATNYGALYNVSEGSTCSGATGFVRVSPIAGVSAENASLLLRFAGTGFTEPTGCAHGTKMSASNTGIVQAWVRNGAPNN